MRRAGVRAGHPVVVYDDGDSTIAARAWWMLRYFGHDQVRVLDGGFRAWAAAGQPVATDEPRVAAGDFTAVPGHLPVLEAAGAAALARSGVLLDARAGERYRGETEPVDPVAGHIPGALSAPTAANVDAGRPVPPARGPAPPVRAARHHGGRSPAHARPRGRGPPGTQHQRSARTAAPG